MDVAVGGGEAGRRLPLEGEPVFTAYVVVGAAAIVADAGIAVADLLRARFVLANSAEVGVPASWLPRLAGLKAAGAAGL
ncbi:DoxX family protein, partial [Streptomyces sp. SID5926]|nr:DoxX family protein [Streptomyces sp. SID5926]